MRYKLRIYKLHLMEIIYFYVRCHIMYVCILPFDVTNETSCSVDNIETLTYICYQ